MIAALRKTRCCCVRSRKGLTHFHNLLASKDISLPRNSPGDQLYQLKGNQLYQLKGLAQSTPDVFHCF